jgi:uncharacterized protein (UPF0332 family)
MNDQREVDALLLMADASICGAQVLLEEDLPGFAASRAYYGMFYAAEALLLSEGLRLSKHAAVISKFGELFAKTGRMDSRLHRYFIDAQQTRLVGDYRPLIEVPPRQAEIAIAHAKEFVHAARQYLQEQHNT